MRKIAEHNETNGATHTVGINFLTDMTQDEKKVLLGYRAKDKKEDLRAHGILETDALPDSVNWVTKGAVGPVRNQGQCGSCWAFSAVEEVEGAMAIKTGKFVAYSVQQLVDCDKTDMGCSGGLMDNAFAYI